MKICVLTIGAEHGGRKTVTTKDVVFALRRVCIALELLLQEMLTYLQLGTPIYGFDELKDKWRAR